MKLILQIGLTALAFAFVLPLISGISFHGNFVAALVMSLFFGVMLWIVDVVAIAISAVIAVGSFGLALLWLIPLWVLGFWLLPAVTLKLTADLLPTYLTVTGWVPAILGGLVLMVIGMVTSISTRRSVPSSAS